ncbi:MAG: arabinogalactan endo-1,4-beta-galactosidase [Sphingomonadales bacterium]|nr:arabinogalactan endo-1,4-beta-galactosidase [Sphingomonadales bacterium]
MKFTSIIILFCSFTLIACKEKPKPKPPTPTAPTTFFKGADVSWLPQMEATGYVFYDENGNPADCLDLLMARGINAVRLRVFVHPNSDKINGHCSPAETAQMAARAKSKGLDVMLDFHYSDTWADPAHQTKPAAWASATFAALKDSVYAHTQHTLNLLEAAGVTPKWVQIGNEIPSGLLWPEGHVNNPGQLAQLINAGNQAVKDFNPTIQTIVHIDQGNDNARFRWFFDLMQQNGAQFDIIGASYYPHWLGTDYTVTISDLGNNLQDMVTRYNKPVMVVEVGGDYWQVENSKDLLIATIGAALDVPDNQCLGVFYWEPQGAKPWSGYQLNCWQDNGRPSPALDAFLY